MPAAKLSMKKIREMLRLRFASARPLTHREIAKSCNTSASTVGECLARCRKANVVWPLPESMTDSQLERAVYRVDPCKDTERPVPDWETVHTELRRRDCHLSLFLLWQEYHAEH